MGKYFGTDGIRGKANTHPMTPETAINVGRAFIRYLQKKNEKPVVVVGKDTRVSGDMISTALFSGICSQGGDVVFIGDLPTPAVPVLIREKKADAGIMVSASHNPYYDNGIKLFGDTGRKLPDGVESEIENLIDDPDTPSFASSNPGIVKRMKDRASDIYLDFLSSCLSGNYNLNGMHIVLDCSNGATYEVAPEIFSRFDAGISLVGAEPDGYNINDGCGSQNTELLQKTVLEKKADMGLAFDGDGDRLISVDEKGERLTGDQMMVIFADALKRKNELTNNLVIATVMSNLGFRKAMNDLDISYTITDVGDRYVYEEMLRSDAALGGEDSGHIIFQHKHTTGDGILSGLLLLQAMKETGNPLSEMKKMMTVFPQLLVNIEVDQKIPVENLPNVKKAVRVSEKKLGNKGRVHVRYSGTRNLLRIMVEAPTKEDTRKHCGLIADAVKADMADLIRT